MSHCDLSPRLGGAGVPLQGVGTQLATGPRLLSGCPQPPIMSPQDLPVPPGSSQRVHTPRHGPRTFCFDPDRNTPDCPVSTLRSPGAFARLSPVLSHTPRVALICYSSVLVSAGIVHFLELGGSTAAVLCFVTAASSFCRDRWPGAGCWSVGGEQSPCASPICTFHCCYFFALLLSLNWFFYLNL